QFNYLLLLFNSAAYVLFLASIIFIIHHHHHHHPSSAIIVHLHHHHLNIVIRMNTLHLVSEPDAPSSIKPSFPRVMIAQIYLEGEAQRWILEFKKEAEKKITWEELKVAMRTKFKVDFPRFVGDEDPTIWICQADQYFQFYRTVDADKVFIASIFLEGEAQLWLRAMKDSAQEVTWEQMKEWLYARYSPIKIDEGNKSSEVLDCGNFILELPVQEEEVIQECKERDESSGDISTKNSSVLFFSTVDINSYAADGFRLKEENIEDESTNLMSLIMEDSIVNLGCVFIFLLVNWIDPDGSHFKLFDNG
ncbi:hypothetical protein LINPERPRIM_LOCUS2707, partial [Linum perenne]